MDLAFGVSAQEKERKNAMKRLLLLIVLYCASLMTMAQDVIVKKDGSTLLSKVMEINSLEIKYKKWSNLEGPVYSINRADVLSINYQNGEIDKFIVEEEEPLVPEIIKEGRMERKGQDLTLDGCVLTDDEVRRLIGEDNYQTFLGARKQINIGNGFAGLLVVSLLAGGTSIVAMCCGSKEVAFPIILVSSAVVTLITIPIICVFKGIGKGRMSRIADNYNKYGNAVSFQVASSMMNINNPLIQGNTCLGLTFSLNF